MKPANPVSVFVALAVLGVALLFLGTAVGSQGWEPLLLRADGPQSAILWEIRIPRTLGAWSAGAFVPHHGLTRQPFHAHV